MLAGTGTKNKSGLFVVRMSSAIHVYRSQGLSLFSPFGVMFSWSFAHQQGRDWTMPEALKHQRCNGNSTQSLVNMKKTEAAFPWDVVCFWLWSGNWCESWMLMLNGRQSGHDLLLVGNFIDGWCVGLYERFLEEALSLHQKLFGDLQDYTFGSVLAPWQLSKNLHQNLLWLTASSCMFFLR